VLRTSHDSREVRLFSGDVLPFFDATALEVPGEIEVSDGRFSIAVVAAGDGWVEGDFGSQPIRRGQTFALPASLPVRIRAGREPLRVIRCLIAQADVKWYTTPDRLVDGVKINDVDLHSLRKIAATAVSALERWGTLDRPLAELMAVMTPEELQQWSDSVALARSTTEKLLADNPEILSDPIPSTVPSCPQDPEGPDGRVNAR